MAVRDNTQEEKLIDYALDLDLEMISSEDQDYLCNLILDQIAIGVGAISRNLTSGVLCEEYVLKNNGSISRAALWSGKGSVSTTAAAFANGVWTEVLDFQDVVVDPRNNGHVAVVVVPAAMAVAEAVGAGGRQLLSAIAAGIEVTIAILRALGRSHLSDGRGFRTTNLAAPSGAAIACAKLLDLNQEQALNALGIAGACQNSGLMASLSPSGGNFAMDKDMANGLSAQLGVLAAELAEKGLTGSHNIISGERGLAASYGFGDQIQLKVPNMADSNITCVAMKKYPACYGVQSAVEATMKLAREHRVTQADVSNITVKVKRSSAETLNIRQINNHMAARFSLPYCVAVALKRDRLALEDFEPPSLNEPQLLNLMNRIDVVADDDMTGFHNDTGGFPAIVKLSTNTATYTERMDYPPGTKQNPIPENDLIDKFNILTREYWNENKRNRFIELISGLKELNNIQTLTNLFSAGN